MTSSRLALASLALGACALAACGGSSTPSAATATPPTRSVPPATSSTAPGSSPPGIVASQVPVAPESNPPGDIPDNLAFVTYENAAGRYSFTHPEGWARTESGTAVSFTDKLNGVSVDVGPDTQSPTKAQAHARTAELMATQPAFELIDVSEVSGAYGSGTRTVYRRNSEPDPVTGRQYRDEVERYEVVANGREVVMELYGPVGADNIDAYREMITSLAIA